MSRTVYCKTCGKQLETNNYQPGSDYYCSTCFAEHNRVKPCSYKTNPDGSVTTFYSDGTQRTQTQAQIKRGFWQAIIIILVIVVGGFTGIRYWSYSSNQSQINDNFEISSNIQGDGADFISAILNKDDAYVSWDLKIENEPSEFLDSIFRFSDDFALIRYQVKDNTPVYYFDFEDYDAGTGLNGKYYLATVNGVLSLIDNNNKTIYPEGTEFFAKHYKALSAFAYDSFVTSKIGDLAGGEYGNDRQSNTVLKKDDTLLSEYTMGEDNPYTFILDGSGKDRMYYRYRYYTEDKYTLPDFNTYKTAEK